jgi:membrane-bound metal-dependent hydrolase YbcI (DUF457 family)
MGLRAVSPIAHSGIGLLGWQLTASRKNFKTLFLFLFVANLPDIDFLLYLLFRTRRWHIHQYFTHNIFFVMIAAALLSLFLKAGKDRVGLILVGVFHLVQDIFVLDRGWPKGIRLFYPLSSKFFNVGFFPNLQRGSLWHMLSLRNISVLALETLVFIVPIIVIFWKKLGQESSRRDFWTI